MHTLPGAPRGNCLWEPGKATRAPPEKVEKKLEISTEIFFLFEEDDYICNVTLKQNNMETVEKKKLNVD